MPPSILVNAAELIVALESSDSEVEWYLDLVTGEVLPLFSEGVADDTTLADALDTDPDRYIGIDPIGSTEAFRIMEAFVASLPDGSPAAGLTAALRQKHPFRHFKHKLEAWPVLRDQWFSFHYARMREVAEDWIAANDLSVALSTATESESEA